MTHMTLLLLRILYTAVIYLPNCVCFFIVNNIYLNCMYIIIVIHLICMIAVCATVLY